MFGLYDLIHVLNVIIKCIRYLSALPDFDCCSRMICGCQVTCYYDDNLQFIVFLRMQVEAYMYIPGMLVNFDTVTSHHLQPSI